MNVIKLLNSIYKYRSNEVYSIGDLVEIVGIESNRSKDSDNSISLGEVCKVINIKDRTTRRCNNYMYCSLSSNKQCLMVQSIEDEDKVIWTCYSVVERVE